MGRIQFSGHNNRTFNLLLFVSRFTQSIECSLLKVLITFLVHLNDKARARRCSWFKGLFLSTPVTLQDCLDAYFRTDVLDDENRYSCKHCRTLRNGLKYAHVLRLPEVLCIHLKRFRHDFAQSTKLHKYDSHGTILTALKKITASTVA